MTIIEVCQKVSTYHLPNLFSSNSSSPTRPSSSVRPLLVRQSIISYRGFYLLYLPILHVGRHRRQSSICCPLPTVNCHLSPHLVGAHLRLPLSIGVPLSSLH
eukprot:Gb_40669 [translate_table: standard]